MPGERRPPFTGQPTLRGASSANGFAAYDGNLRSACTPSIFSITLRANGAVLALFTICTTTGIVASLPTRSVLVSSRSRMRVLPLRNLRALARSIRCGKSTFQGCGGT